jgi:hypothetical protein
MELENGIRGALERGWEHSGRDVPQNVPPDFSAPRQLIWTVKGLSLKP